MSKPPQLYTQLYTDSIHQLMRRCEFWFTFSMVSILINLLLVATIVHQYLEGL